jgi:hypothetical protein
MQEWGHQAASRAQRKYGVKSPTDVIPQDPHEGPGTPLSGKASTMGSLNQRLAWKTPSGVGYSAATKGSTLFDTPSSPAQVPKEG